MIKKYKFGFELFGLLLFILIMIPNILWFVMPAPNDVLRNESVTPIIDMFGSIFQFLMIAGICMIKNSSVGKCKISPFLVLSFFCVLVYFCGWGFYFIGIVNPIIVLLLTLVPCFSFIFFIIDRKNNIVLIPAVGFAICHLLFAILNFIV